MSLAGVLDISSGRRRLGIGLSPLDCTTVAETRNCTEACSDPASLFTPANHALRCLPLVSWYRMGRMQSTRRIARRGRSWNPGRSRLYQYSTLPTSFPASRNVSLNPVSSWGWADARLLCKAWTSSRPMWTTSACSLQCWRSSFRTNADIAGPGVLLSHYFQNCSVFLLFLLLKSSTTWPSRLGRLFRRWRRQQKQQTESPGNSTRLKLSDSVKSTLVEFQEMQIYFCGIGADGDASQLRPGGGTDPAGANNTSGASAIVS